MGKELDILQSEKMYTVPEVAQILGVDKRTIYNYFKLGEISHFKLSERKTLVAESEIEAFLKDKKIERSH